MSVPSPQLPRPVPPRTWREQLAGVAESLNVSPPRLLVGVVVLAGIGVLGWRLLAPPPPPPEVTLPFAESSTGPATDSPAVPSTGVSGGPPGSADAAGEGPGDGATTLPATEVVVHVAGAVSSPGVQRLPPGSRVIDGLEAAGGALPDADLARVNLAAPLADGQQVYVPKPGEQPPEVVGAGPSGGPGAGPGALVNVNTATAEQLETLPGVGPATAAAIIAHRDANGPFASPDELIDVRGIGEAKLEQLRDLVAV
ncbi:MAG TPA: ComEA family DNA-binding protein [Acidimicrobiales bacterium]|nr:ComEA family DNA-binding protein [Acidimicrobiales bacterium]